MSVHPTLLPLLADPLDHGTLLPIAGDELYNPRLGLAYPLRDGVPVLLADAARPVPRPGTDSTDGTAGPGTTTREQP